MPASAAAVAAAPLTESGLNMDMSMPAFSNTNFIHRAIVACCWALWFYGSQKDYDD